MSCHHPLTAFFTGSKTEKGKDDFVIGHHGDTVFRCSAAEKRGHHIGPSAKLFTYNGIAYLADPIPIPCGHCVGCRMDKAFSWKVRCCLEALACPDDVYFVTLTYRDACCPHYLSKEDLQKFHKRLRKLSGIQYRYFSCGEYGDKNYRPHYHMIIFGCPFPDLERVGVNEYVSKTLERAWPFGISQIKEASPEMVAYVCGYTEKKALDPNYKSKPGAPFLLMSRRPGIGAAALTFQRQAILNSFKVYGDFGSSRHSASLPVYFKRKLSESDPDWFQEVHDDVIKIAKALEKNNLSRFGGITDSTLIGFALDAASYAKLENLRKEKL